jgi:hypothetical protein
MDKRKKLYSLYHLNLAFSAIPESERAKVIERCYVPLINLARDTGCPVSIEASGWTLQQIADISPKVITDLRTLIAEGLCEFIGSGYIQAIGPLMPELANIANQRIGMDVYQQLLGHKPDIALINEQALSAGLIPIYRDAGYKGIILDWANVYSAHQDWDTAWAHYPQLALDPTGNDFPVIWCDAITFQKFQRHAHGEIDAAEFEEFVGRRLENMNGGFLAIYGSDAEIFDYRPGRYGTEADIQASGEWSRLEDLYSRLAARDDYHMTTPSEILKTGNLPAAWNSLALQSASAPVVVKKQPKYNIIRWALTGRDDLALNTACWRLFEDLKSNTSATDDDWRQLLELWSSDYRTHIDDERWQEISDMVAESPSSPPLLSEQIKFAAESTAFTIDRDDRFLTLMGAGNVVTLNLRRGCAIQAMAPTTDESWWVGTIPHGFFEDIAWGADFYTGHLTCEIPGQAKVTDLAQATPEIGFTQKGEAVARVAVSISTGLGDIRKTILVYANRPRIEFEYQLDWPEPILGSLRMAHVTLNPDTFGEGELSYSCHNGGSHLESFALGDQEFNLGAPVSTLITCASGVGLTGGVLEIGDQDRRVRLESPRSKAAMIGLVTSKEVGPHRFVRASLSAREHDDTSREGRVAPLPNRPLAYCFAIELITGTADQTSR